MPLTNENVVFAVSHQKEMIKRGVLKQLIECISSEHFDVQIKAFEVLLRFDGNAIVCNQVTRRLRSIPSCSVALCSDFYRFPVEHQSAMISEGILARLTKLIFSENVQVQTRALSVIQCFEGGTDEVVVSVPLLTAAHCFPCCFCGYFCYCCFYCCCCCCC